MNLLEQAEGRRRATLDALDETNQAQMGQFFTPTLVAQIMTSMPTLPKAGQFRVLDPGAGSGVLSAAILDRVRAEAPNLKVCITAVEADASLLEPLAETLSDCEEAGAETDLVNDDFVTWALKSDDRFDLVIQNPPYHKLRSGSETDLALRSAGIVVPNIYAAFMALGSLMLNDSGQQVSITPRSWMNGTYYGAFRRSLLAKVGIDTIHTFESRSKVFGDMGVLQESIIVAGTRGAQRQTVRLSSSRDHNDAPVERLVPHEQVVTSDFIFVPASEEDGKAVSWMNRVGASLADLGLTVSTGRVVDFRSKDLLVQDDALGRSPMVYPANIGDGKVTHPRADLRKPQWFEADPVTASKLLVPCGTYVVIKRFSAKEEKRRIVAAVWSGDRTPAFDNKLNYIHANGHGLDSEVARGLANWLNSTQVDDYFRVFSGHTQVNAGDLRQMKFPSLDQLRALGQSATGDIDSAVEYVTREKTEVAA